jgi:tRNA-uridine 2-sulfurtransferase
VTSSGEVIGHHAGIHNFTIGQRKGLGVSSPDPLYVLQIDQASHRVTVGAGSEATSQAMRTRNLNWISVPELTEEMRVRVKIRHRHEPAWATLRKAGGGGAEALFDEPQRAVTPGQAAVFYDGDEVVGGGWII